MQGCWRLGCLACKGVGGLAIEGISSVWLLFLFLSGLVVVSEAIIPSLATAGLAVDGAQLLLTNIHIAG